MDPLHLAADLFPRPVSHRLQDFVVGSPRPRSRPTFRRSISSATDLAALGRRPRTSPSRTTRCIVESDIYYGAYLSSVWIALVATFLTLLIAYPIAYGMARAPEHWRPMLLMFIILPFWTSFLIRVYAWMGILSHHRLPQHFPAIFGIIDEPLEILNTNTAVYIGIVYSYLPFMVLPLYASLEKMDDTLLEAASDLGSTPLRAFWQVTFPISLPGVIAGCFLVFIPAVGEFVIPDLLGGSETQMIGKVMWDEFFSTRDWPAASAVAVVLLLILVVPIALYQKQQAKAAGGHP